ncbi:MAG: DEAD/DEAH box helicase family protein [Candidatus Bathyarchaeia archaeon]|jgi:type III restriction enzyme
MISLMDFQIEAKDSLTEKFVNLWKKQERQLPLVLKSPTGSGKTLVIAHTIRGLNHLPNWDEDKAFVWITFSDDIAMQSKSKFERFFENTLENELLTVDDIIKGKLFKNDILFLNWQKVVTRSAESRLLRRPEKEEERKESGVYFEDFIDNTHKDGREIILVIDEAHTHVTKDLAQEIIDYINPKIVFHITATPSEEIELKSRRLDSYVEVDHLKVVEEGLIKEKILVQTEEDLKKSKADDLDEILLELGIERRKAVEKEYKKIGKKITPLTLIQLPNDDKKLIDQGEKTKEEIVIDYLLGKGINKDKIALWFDGKKVNMDFIEENDNEVEYMLFKQAAGTGWDCPRAHILVMFREISSDKFYIQTVGRILRMAEPDKKEEYKNSQILRTGFLFTNYERNKINAKWNEISPTKPDIYFARIKSNIENIQIESQFVSRLEYGDLSSSAKFQASFLNTMNKYFSISPSDAITGVAFKKLTDKGINIHPVLTNQLIVDAKFQDFEEMNFDFQKQGHDVALNMSKNDVEKTFNYYCLKLLKEQTEEAAKISNVARSWSPLKSALRVWLKGIFEEDSDRYYRIFVFDINKNERSVFRPTITQAIKDYKPILLKLIEERQKSLEKKEATIFTIQQEYSFTDDYEEVDAKLYALDKCYFLKDYLGRLNEARFRNYLELKKDKIQWWFKNFDYGKEYFSIKYFNSEQKTYRLFYPDWIVKLKDGRIGIFDTKAGDTARPEKTREKAYALNQRLKALGKKFIGGIVIFENGIWYYNCSENYDYLKGSLDKNWKNLENIL